MDAADNANVAMRMEDVLDYESDHKSDPGYKSRYESKHEHEDRHEHQDVRKSSSTMMLLRYLNKKRWLPSLALNP